MSKSFLSYLKAHDIGDTLDCFSNIEVLQFHCELVVFDARDVKRILDHGLQVN